MNAVGVVAMNVQQTVASGARVVIVEPDAGTRNVLREAIHRAHTFVLAGVAPHWHTGVDLLDLYVPELLIVRDTELSTETRRRLGAAIFPIVVSLNSAPDNSRSCGVLTTLRLPVDEHAVSTMLDKARSEIYARKANELSQLLDNYLNAAYVPRQYLSNLRVDDHGRTIEIATEDVVSIAADGNYVRVQTMNSTYEMRETMSGLSEKLDPRSFVRAHRSFIVNLRYVQDVVDRGSSSLVLLHDGAEIPVGPNYRTEISESVSRKLRLTA